MLKKIGIIAILLLFSATLAVAAVSEDKIKTAKTGGYTVGPANGTGEDIGILWVNATITQGQTNWHTKDVTTFITTLNVDLNWGNPGNSLRLTIYSPDGYVFGPYFDIDDGSINGRINRYINNPNSIAKGTWYYEVYGYSVSGTED
ncbi:MAG: peptidase domain-containing protein [Euryarchaeota archaeon]|nr:peptidase domain-containing protein [Euryarchaeota archaeon]MCG2738440.1 peptidase domain-containing protein [Candidatus Methanoperedenaceae archaeon]